MRLVLANISKLYLYICTLNDGTIDIINVVIIIINIKIPKCLYDAHE